MANGSSIFSQQNQAIQMNYSHQLNHGSSFGLSAIARHRSGGLPQNLLNGLAGITDSSPYVSSKDPK